jgi:hypothetical protein
MDSKFLVRACQAREKFGNVSVLKFTAATVSMQASRKESSVDGVTGLVAEIRAFRPFLPAKEFETSLRFYKAIGFEVYPLGETLAELSLGTHAFLLQGDYVKEWAENSVMHVLVEDVDAWWRHIESLALTRQFGVSPPTPPRVEPWGLTVAYVSDPSGVLWHFAQTTVENPNPGTP